MPGYDPDFEAIRKDAEKWRERATAEGAYTDPRAEETLRLLAELARLRVVEAEYETVIPQQEEPQGVNGPFTVELSGDFDEVWSHMFADDEGFIRIRLVDAHGDEMRQLVHRLEEENSDLRESLTMLRNAWNAHMDKCTNEYYQMVDQMKVTPEDVRAWRNAPSTTMSAETDAYRSVRLAAEAQLSEYTSEEKRRLAEWADAGNNQPPADLDPTLPAAP